MEYSVENDYTYIDLSHFNLQLARRGIMVTSVLVFVPQTARRVNLLTARVFVMKAGGDQTVALVFDENKSMHYDIKNDHFIL